MNTAGDKAGTSVNRVRHSHHQQLCANPSQQQQKQQQQQQSDQPQPQKPPQQQHRSGQQSQKQTATNKKSHTADGNKNKRQNNISIRPDPSNPRHRYALPHPLPPSKCPLLCVFYAEFDIVVGPKVCFQSPHKFMHFDVNVNEDEVYNALEETFSSILPEDVMEVKKKKEYVGEEHGMEKSFRNSSSENDSEKNEQFVNEVANNRGPLQNDGPIAFSPSVKLNTCKSDESQGLDWSRSAVSKVSNLSTSEDSHFGEHDTDNTSQATLPTAKSSAQFSCEQSPGQKKSETFGYQQVAINDANSMQRSMLNDSHLNKQKQQNQESQARHKSSNVVARDPKNAPNLTSTVPIAKSPSFGSSKGTSVIAPCNDGESTVDTDILQNSIFAATSEYIITGNELANQTITVSTHGMHILSRPMIISDTRRYERNSLLFAVGFVLKRNVNPRPYWPILSNLSSTFFSMEVESEFLSNVISRPHIQIVLEDVLVSLNSKQRNCHLLLDDANLLNLQLFRPPPPPTPSVPDYAVPILLRPEWQLQIYDWDLTINWIIPHIDGRKYVKQISRSAEVDIEMVRACLRVLRHHGVLAHVDVFRYRNVYEVTPLGIRLFSEAMSWNGGCGGNESGKKSKSNAEELKLLDDAFRYSIKGKYGRRAHATARGRFYSTNSDSSGVCFSPTTNTASGKTCPKQSSFVRHPHHQSTIHGLDLSLHSSASLLTFGSYKQKHVEEISTPRSFPSRMGNIAIAEEYSIGADTHSRNKSPTMNHKEDSGDVNAAEIAQMKEALAWMFCSCNRNQTFGEILLNKIATQVNNGGYTKSCDSDRGDISANYPTNENTLNALDSTLSPLREGSESDPGFDRRDSGWPATSQASHCNTTTNYINGIDWRKAFDYFDHRRLITFGVIHGLIRRVHQYPLANEIGRGSFERDFADNRSNSEASNINDDVDDYSNMDFTADGFLDIDSPKVTSPLAASNTIQSIELSNIAPDFVGTEATAFNEPHISPCLSHNASPLLRGVVPPPPLHTVGDFVLNKIAQQKMQMKAKKVLIEKISIAMDGTRCDDELSCMFEMPLENIINMIEDTGHWGVISVFADSMQ